MNLNWRYLPYTLQISDRTTQKNVRQMIFPYFPTGNYWCFYVFFGFHIFSCGVLGVTLANLRGQGTEKSSKALILIRWTLRRKASSARRVAPRWRRLGISCSNPGSMNTMVKRGLPKIVMLPAEGPVIFGKLIDGNTWHKTSLHQGG